jgi:hypothetical protein
MTIISLLVTCPPKKVSINSLLVIVPLKKVSIISLVVTVPSKKVTIIVSRYFSLQKSMNYLLLVTISCKK